MKKNFWNEENCLEQLKTKLTRSIFDIHGMSTPEVRIFLNELVKEDTNYLEIGIHIGSTFVSAMYGNKPNSSFAIDVFRTEKEVRNFLQNCRNNRLSDFICIRNDSFSLYPKQKQNIKNINTYFYDGGHSTKDHEMSLTYFYGNLSDVFILIVDDWVHPAAKKGTLSAIEKMNLKIQKDWEFGYSQHLRIKNPIEAVRNLGLSWHNGLYVAVLEKQ